jgi:vacuolar-type H+-ATPase subunit F/Vma7
MSRLLVITRPTLVSGFRLAGVDAYGVENIEDAENLIDNWLKADEVGLLAIDDGLMEVMALSVKKRLEEYEKLPYITIPGGGSLGTGFSRRHHITEMIRRAIGFHITFKGEDTEER